MTATKRAPGGGRKPRPTAQKIAAGNPGKRPLNTAEPQYAAITSAEPPEGLPEVGALAWRYYAPLLIERKVLTVADLHNLEAFCVNVALWRDARAQYEAHGVLLPSQGGFKKNPAITAMHEAEKAMATFGALLGLDPASRSRLVAPGDPGAGNPFAALVPARG